MQVGVHTTTALPCKQQLPCRIAGRLSLTGGATSCMHPACYTMRGLLQHLLGRDKRLWRLGWLLGRAVQGTQDLLVAVPEACQPCSFGVPACAALSQGSLCLLMLAVVS